MQTARNRNIFLSTMPASRRDRMAALAVVIVSSVLFACAAPLAKVPLTPVPAFVASYQSVLVVNDLITAILLYSQFGLLRSRALLLLASGYLFTAVAATIHLLTFPGVFAPAGLLGAGPQTTAWLYMVWHAGFPLFVLGYALLKKKDGGATTRGSVGGAILGSVIAVGVTMSVLTWVVIARGDILPIIVSGGHFNSTLVGVESIVGFLALAAPLLVLWFRRPHSVIDVWLMVVLCAWLFDIALSAILNAGRFDLGFYAGRLYGACAASFVLAALLVHSVDLQAQLARLLASLWREAASERDRHTERERLFSAVVESSNDAIPKRSTAPSPAGTALPNACLDTPQQKRSAATSTSPSHLTGAPRCVTSSSAWAGATPSNIMKPCGCARMVHRWMWPFPSLRSGRWRARPSARPRSRAISLRP
jgi:Membrane-associated sensor, integral membrane domain